jgi:DNA-binding MarR family transcriptional regulator
MLRMTAQKGYHHGEAICLPLLVGNDGIIQRDLAEILHVSRPQVTKIVQALEQKGVVVRRNDGDDQRLTRVYVTEEGRRRELEMRSFWEEYLDQTIGSLSEADRAELQRLLGLLSARVSKLLDDEV